MDYDKMVVEAIERFANKVPDSEFRRAIHIYAEDIANEVRAAMNDNMVVFYQP